VNTVAYLGPELKEPVYRVIVASQTVNLVVFRVGGDNVDGGGLRLDRQTHRRGRTDQSDDWICEDRKYHSVNCGNCQNSQIDSRQQVIHGLLEPA
jgi:hypothetical protein